MRGAEPKAFLQLVAESSAKSIEPTLAYTTYLSLDQEALREAEQQALKSSRTHRTENLSTEAVGDVLDPIGLFLEPGGVVAFRKLVELLGLTSVKAAISKIGS